MKSWKEVPHLFANGKFKMAYNDEKYPCDVWAYHQPDQFHLFDNEAGMSDFIALKDCTLIARRISDMTDRELLRILRWNYKDHHNSPEKFRDLLMVTAANGNMTTNNLIYLLNHGIYPLSQYHFETGEVLDAKESV